TRPGRQPPHASRLQPGQDSLAADRPAAVAFALQLAAGDRTMVGGTEGRQHHGVGAVVAVAGRPEGDEELRLEPAPAAWWLLHLHRHIDSREPGRWIPLFAAVAMNGVDGWIRPRPVHSGKGAGQLLLVEPGGG